MFSVDVFRDVHATLGRHSELDTTPAVISRLGVSFGLYYKSSDRLKVEYNQHKFPLTGWVDWRGPLTIRFIRSVGFFFRSELKLVSKLRLYATSIVFITELHNLANVVQRF